jgi:Pyruvate/2-oxoacid:ferredoxin oxidoreductase delta subunit
VDRQGAVLVTGLRYLAGVASLEYDRSKCTGCQLCTMVCPHAVFVMEGDRASLVDRDACMECGACARNCAFGAISVDAGVGCAAAIIASWFGRRRPTCGPDDTASGSCCG